MSQSKYTGFWVGGSVGDMARRISVRLDGDPDKLSGFALVRAYDDVREIVEICGREDDDGKAQLTMKSYLSNSPGRIEPSGAHITLGVGDEEGVLNGIWGSDIGTHGKVLLETAGRFNRMLLSFPPIFYKAAFLTKRSFKAKFRYYYLTVIVTLSFLSAIGQLPKQISWTEVVLLVMPLIFLFSDTLQRLLTGMSIKKLGPIEFQEQSRPPIEFNLPQIINVLHDEFGDQFQQFNALYQFFVPGTKVLLNIIASAGRPLSNLEVETFAKRLGIIGENYSTTLEALTKGQCIETDEAGNIGITDTGRKYLLFEARLRNLYGWK